MAVYFNKTNVLVKPKLIHCAFSYDMFLGSWTSVATIGVTIAKRSYW